MLNDLPAAFDSESHDLAVLHHAIYNINEQQQKRRENEKFMRVFLCFKQLKTINKNLIYIYLLTGFEWNLIRNGQAMQSIKVDIEPLILIWNLSSLFMWPYFYLINAFIAYVQQRRFNFFDKELVKDPKDASKNFEELKVTRHVCLQAFLTEYHQVTLHMLLSVCDLEFDH